MLKSKLFLAGLIAAALSLVAVERSEAQFGFAIGGQWHRLHYVSRPWYGSRFGLDYGFYQPYEYCCYYPYYYNYNPCWYGGPWISCNQPPTTNANQIRTQPVVNSTATIGVHVPASAELWFDGNKSTQTGTQRVFVTPTLTAGTTNSYEVRATWTDPKGTPVTEVCMIQVQPGQQSVVNLMK